MNLNASRISQLVARAAESFSLNLKGLCVLTEAATHEYRVTPIIAALAGSPTVLAMAKDSAYGSAKDVGDGLMNYARLFGVKDRIQVLLSRNDTRIGEADIVTNLAGVRPLDSTFLKRLSPRAVIPLMWETWEFRPEDVDLETCHERHIPILGTNEHHPLLHTFAYLGQLAVKLLHESGIEILNSTIVVIGGPEFSSDIARTLTSNGARVSVLSAEALRNRSEPAKLLASADALLICEHRDKGPLISENEGIRPSELKDSNQGLVVTHICGNVDARAIMDAGLSLHPRNPAPPGYMSFSTSYVGLRPLIDLHSAGLRVGQVMAEAVRSGLSGIHAEIEALKTCEFSQGFPNTHGELSRTNDGRYNSN